MRHLSISAKSLRPLRFRLSVICVSILGAQSSSFAQWTVQNLNPFGSSHSNGFGGANSYQVGSARVGSSFKASLWSGSGSTWVDLTPAGATSGSANGAFGNQQGGTAIINGENHAGMWAGTANSWIDLHPFGTENSMISDIDEGQQVGMVGISDTGHASLWSGTASSWIDLNPQVAEWSFVYGVGDGQQVGDVIIDNIRYASLWSGSASSWVNLNPSGSTWSEGNDASDGQQVGESVFAGVTHAGVWYGSASTWVDLHPSGATCSEAYGVDKGKQVGMAIMEGVRKAGIWSGTAESWKDLHDYLPPSFSDSTATRVWHDANNIFVVGSGWNNATGQQEALLWVCPITFTMPTAYAVRQGLDFGGNLGSLFNSDDDKVFVLCDELDSTGEIQFDATLPAGIVNQLKFRFEGSATRSDLSQFVRMYNYATNSYSTVSFQSSTLIDSVVEGAISASASQYYSANRDVKSRVLWVPQSDISAGDGWTQSCDQAMWTMN